MALVETMLAAIPKPEHHPDLVDAAFPLSHYVAGTEHEDRGRDLFFEWYKDSPKSRGEGASLESDEKLEALWQDGITKALRGGPNLKTIGSIIAKAIECGWDPADANAQVHGARAREQLEKAQASGIDMSSVLPFIPLGDSGPAMILQASLWKKPAVSAASFAGRKLPPMSWEVDRWVPTIALNFCAIPLLSLRPT
jgi:hypothetical protein